MANGTILVVGGEDGSNGPPVPTLEILPKHGPSLYMDWLQESDPWNLYPFVAVIKGGVFVAYWNQARILDENTFDTIRVSGQFLYTCTLADFEDPAYHSRSSQCATRW
jgi:hypothetical protein